MKPVWIWRTQAHRIYQVGSHTIIPTVRSIGVHWRGPQQIIGWLWQFPVAVDVEDEATATRTRYPIPDTTRTVVWFLGALTLVFVGALAFMQWRNRKRALPTSPRLPRKQGQKKGTR